MLARFSNSSLKVTKTLASTIGMFVSSPLWTFELLSPSKRTKAVKDVYFHKMTTQHFVYSLCKSKLNLAAMIKILDF